MPSQFETPSQFEHTIRTGSAAIAEATRPTDVTSIRARGDQRLRRQFVGSAAAVVAITAAGGVTIAHVVADGGVERPAPATSQHHGPSHGRVTPQIQAAIIPNVVGLVEPAAVSVLTSFGFNVTVMNGCSGATLPAGTVCSSDPASFSVSLRGTTVVIEVVPQRHH
jgi:hypothetical protein